MKTRTGFVSNSSSSSFVIYGNSMEASEFVSLLGKTDVIESDDIYTAVDEAGGELEGTGLMYIHDSNSDCVYVGLDPWYDMKEGETKGEFMKRAKALVQERFPGKVVDYLKGEIES